MDEITDNIERVNDILNILKSRYFFLRSKNDIELGSLSINAAKDIQTEYQYASSDLQTFIMVELHLLEYACTYGIYSMNMYATRLKTNLIDNDKDHHFLKLLKDKIRYLIGTNKEIKNLKVDSDNDFHSYINSFMVYTNVLNEINVPNTIQLDQTDVEKKKNKLLKKISKINLMANLIFFLVSDSIKDFKTEEGRAALNMAIKYRTPRNVEYYSNKLKSK